MLLARQSRYTEAVEYFENIAQLTPGDEEVHACLGNLYERLGRKRESEEHFSRQAGLERERRLQAKVKTEVKEHMETALKILEKLGK